MVPWVISEFHNHAQNVRARHQCEGLASLAGHTLLTVNMAGSVQEVNVGGKKPAVNYTFTALYWAVFIRQVFANPWSSSGLSSPLRILKQSNYWHSSILSAMFTGACGSPEKPSLALVSRSCVLRTNVKLAYWQEKLFFPILLYG